MGLSTTSLLYKHPDASIFRRAYLVGLLTSISWGTIYVLYEVKSGSSSISENGDEERRKEDGMRRNVSGLYALLGMGILAAVHRMSRRYFGSFHWPIEHYGCCYCICIHVLWFTNEMYILDTFKLEH